MYGYIIGAVCVIIGGVLVGRPYRRNSTQIARINVEDVPSEKHRERKNEIIEERLQRKLRTGVGAVQTYARPAIALVRNKARQSREWLYALEQRYHTERLAAKSEGATSQDHIQRKDFVDKAMLDVASMLEEGKLEAAERKCIEAITVNPQRYEAYLHLGWVYIDKDDKDSAIASMRHGAKLLEKKADKQRLLDSQRQELSEAYFAIADILRTQESYALALTYSQRSAAMEKNNPRFIDHVVSCAILAGDAVVANEALSHLRRINPENNKIAEFEEQVKAL